jgi:hypothetical protein
MASIDFRELIILRTITSTRRIICTRAKKAHKEQLALPAILYTYGRISRHHTKEIKRSTGDHLPLKMSDWKFESPRAANRRGSSAARPWTHIGKRVATSSCFQHAAGDRLIAYNLDDNATNNKVRSFVRPLA